LESPSSPGHIAASLRNQIATGGLEPGARLIELDYTRAYGVSRHTLREAIAMLVSERLLTRVSFKGVEVTRLAAADIRDIYAGRRAIELPAVDLLASAPKAIARDLMTSIDRLLALPVDVDSERMHLADTAVHAALVAAHGSRRISGMHEMLLAEQNILLFKTYGADDVRLAIQRHGEFRRLIAAADYSGARGQLERRLRASEDQMVNGAPRQDADARV
jgi:DNA-binding GntR family transcriptional regulator